MSKSVRNDSSMPTGMALEVLRRVGIEINYGGLKIRVMRGDFEKTQQHVAALSEAEREHARGSVDKALRSAAPKITGGKFSKEVADNFYADLMLWEALKRIGS